MPEPIEHITCEDLADCLRITPRSVRRRGEACGWPCIYKRIRGGRRKVYVVHALPDEVRAAVNRPNIAAAAVGAMAGAHRAEALLMEMEAARASRHQVKETQLANFARLSKKQQRQAEARYEILQARDAFLRAMKSTKKAGTKLFIREYRSGGVGLPERVERALAKGKRKVTLSWATLYRWETSYRDQGMAGLADGYRPTRTTCIPEHMQTFIQGLLVDRPDTTFSNTHKALQARFDGQGIPSASAVRRFVTQWRDKNASLLLYMRDFDTWRNRHMIALGRSDESIVRLNQVWEFDSTPGDVMLTDGRHSLIGVIDVYSRRAKLLVTPTSRSAAIAALTRRALLDWGVPETAKTDNGSDYVSSHMIRIFEDLGIWQELCREFHPEDKPHIERFFHTFSHSIVELLPGYIGHSVADRKAIENRRSFAHRIMKQGEDPVQVNLSAEELQTICDRWCSAIYHQDAHSGIGGKTPDQVAREWRAPVRRIGNERALDILLSPAPDKEGTRVIAKKGIPVRGGWFQAAELGPHVGQTVFVLEDRTDYGTVHVFRILEDGSREFLCRAVDPIRTGHDRSEIAAKAKAVQEKVMREGRSELKKIAREAATEHIYDEIMAFRERQRANVRDFPRPSEDYTTTALEQAALAVEDIRRAELGPVPFDITASEEAAAGELIDMAAAKRDGRPLPATAQEKYEQLCQDLASGLDLPDADLAWMKRYEFWLETGEQVSL